MYLGHDEDAVKNRKKNRNRCEKCANRITATELWAISSLIVSLAAGLAAMTYLYISV